MEEHEREEIEKKAIFSLCVKFVQNYNKVLWHFESCAPSFVMHFLPSPAAIRHIHSETRELQMNRQIILMSFHYIAFEIEY